MNERTSNMLRNIKASILIKGITLIVSFVLIRILVDRLNAECYGIWVTLYSSMFMFTFFNMGLGNGMKNFLFASIANKDNALTKRIISTSYISMSVIATILIAVACGVFPLFNWSEILNAPDDLSSDLRMLAIVVFASITLQLVFELIVNVMQAYQQSAYGDLIYVVSQIGTLSGVLMLQHIMSNPGLLQYGLVVAITPILVYILFNIILFAKKLRTVVPNIRYYDTTLLKSLLRVGGKFFVIQISMLVMYQSTNMIIAHVVGNEEVTIFSIAYKYCSIIQMLFFLILLPMWSAAGDAFVNNDMDWIRTTVAKLNKIWIMFSLIGIIQFFVAPVVYRVWIGNSIEVDPLITMTCLIYFLVYMKSGIYCHIINGSGKIKVQYIIYLIMSIAYIPLAFGTGHIFGLAGIIGVMTLTQAILYIFMRRQYFLIVSQKAGGIWLK